jgi:hypothetical protein
MDNRVRRLRSRLEALSRGKAPRGVRYPVALRAAVVRLTREAHRAGMGAGALAKQLGLPPGTVTRWGGRVPRQRLRRIRIAPARPAVMSPPSGPVLVTPQGWRIEGLDVATLLRVLQLGA